MSQTRQMTYGTYQQIYTRYAQVMGRKRGASVTFGGSVAWAGKDTNGRHHLNIPTMPPGTVMTPQQIKVFNGYIDHESRHLRDSDFDVLEMDRAKDPLGAYLVNLIEDIRIENNQIKEFPGSRVFLNALAYHVDEESDKQKAEKKEPWTQADEFLALLYKECYVQYRDIDTGYIKGNLRDHPEYVPIADYLAKEMPKMKDCHDVMRIAKRIRELIPKTVDFPKPKPDDGAPLIIYVVGYGSGQPDPSGLSPGSEKAFAVAAGADQHEGRRAVLIYLIPQIDQLNQSLSMKGTNQKEEGGIVLPPCSLEEDRLFEESAEDIHAYNTTRAAVAAETLSLKKMLNIYLRAQKHVAWTKGQEEGELDPDALHRLVTTHDVDVMMERRAKQVMDTDVLLLGDCSSSMSSEMLRATMIVIAEALDGIRWLKLEACGFRTRHGNLPHHPNCGRADPMDILVYKKFEDTYAKTRARLGAVRTSGGTPLGDAYGLAVERLAVRKASRRILWIISDGDPAVSLADHRHSDFALMARLKMKCRRMGIETAGTYVGTYRSKLGKYVDRFAQVSDMSELPAGIMSMMKEIIK